MADMRSRSEGNPEAIWILPDEMREELAEPLGAIITDPEMSSLKGKFIISVGDVCSITLYRRGIMPHLAVVDGKTKRSSRLDLDCIAAEKTVTVRNPEGTITAELWNAVKNAMKSDERTLIKVYGEEDLASLACISLAPEGAYVVYGIPDKGMCVVKVTEKTRKKANGALSRMKKTEA